jgi:DNA replication protein DnaC
MLCSVQQSRDEMEILFSFLAERHERKSVLITSNLVFSDWIRIFKDPMTPVTRQAAIRVPTGGRAWCRVITLGEGSHGAQLPSVRL